MSNQFFGKVAIVTGGSRGIGEGIVRMFAKRGAKVAVGYRVGKLEADALVSEIAKSGCEAISVAGDVAKPDVCQRIVDTVASRFGAIDILVNNAGISKSTRIEGIDHASFTEMMETNVLSTIMMSKAVVQHMGPGGRIINISSRLAFAPLAGFALYSAAKVAINQVTAVFAEELGPKNITVNAIAPGLIETDMARDSIRGRRDQVVAATPLRRLGQPGDIACAVMMLASEDAKWITGRCIRCDGGVS
jgi:3-oxoacyl-[acyl-carrier protein] reductase